MSYIVAVHEYREKRNTDNWIQTNKNKCKLCNKNGMFLSGLLCQCDVHQPRLEGRNGRTQDDISRQTVLYSDSCRKEAVLKCIDGPGWNLSSVLCLGIYCRTAWRYWRRPIISLISWWVLRWPMPISCSSQKHWPISLLLPVVLELALMMLCVLCTLHLIPVCWRPGISFCTLCTSYFMLYPGITSFFCDLGTHWNSEVKCCIISYHLDLLWRPPSIAQRHKVK